MNSSGGSGTAAPPPAKAGAKSAGAPMQAAAPGPGGASSIKRLEARGNVVVTQKDQVVTGETAVFDTKANLITMLGRRGADPMQERAARRSPDGGHDHRRVAGGIRQRQGTGVAPARRRRRLRFSQAWRRRAAALPELKQTEIISITCAIVRCGEVEAPAASLYLPTGYLGVFRWATDIPCALLDGRIKALGARVAGHLDKGVGKAGMVDLLGMFRRRPAKRARRALRARARTSRRSATPWATC